MKKLILSLFLISGCCSHYHTLEVTSTPTSQKFSVIARDWWGNKVSPVNEISSDSLTPFSVTFPGDVRIANVTVTFDNETIQEKSVAFPHQITRTSLNEPILGTGLAYTETENLSTDRKVHFDSKPSNAPTRCWPPKEDKKETKKETK